MADYTRTTLLNFRKKLLFLLTNNSLGNIKSKYTLVEYTPEGRGANTQMYTLKCEEWRSWITDVRACTVSVYLQGSYWVDTHSAKCGCV